MTTTPTIIDAHHHVWDLTVRDQPWITGEALAPLRRSFSLDDLRSEAEAAGVTSTVLVQTVTVAEETPELLALAATDPLVAGVVGWTDLTAPDVAETLARLRELPGGDRLVGIRHQVQEEPDPDWLLRSDVRRGLIAVAESGLVYDLVVKPRQLAAAVSVAADLPELTFVLDHLGKPPMATGRLQPWAGWVSRLAEVPNTACKLSGLLTEAAPTWTVQDLRRYTDTVLHAFGPDRLMFGSDWPVSTLAADYQDVVHTSRALIEHLSAQEQAAALHRTAIRVYDLSTDHVTAPTRSNHRL
ncbi:amidohydrolase family protein [Streptomyces hydrogenans]|uniref:amidohydrolase family protein n=1 Tax=Streptomyces hydrogenans TaxID=1873719 RepID=UPI0036A672F2